MNKIDRKHIVLQVKTKNVIRFPPLEKLLSLKVMKPSKTAVKTADRSDHFKRHCILRSKFYDMFCQDFADWIDLRRTFESLQSCGL